jgi:uncharacterized protein (TIGR00255 family)
MRSMTGYGRATAAFEGRTLTVQVSSVNRRSLDLTVGLPEAWTALESVVGELVRGVAARGKVHVDVELTGDTAGEPVVREALGEALRGFAAMRAREGEALLVDFIQRGEILQRQLEIIAARAPQVPELYRGQLHRRLREAGLDLDLDDERVLREIALFADRCDIAEELTRLRSHFEQFSGLLRAEGEVGRRAEFLLQEIGREVNTIGSKANDLTISRAVLELKNELERIREQMANVE